MSQLSLPGVHFVPWRPLARKTDPATSHAAADAAKSLTVDHHCLILGALAQGPAGVDCIAALTRLNAHQIGKRMAELERAGAIRLTGKTVPSTSGRQQREWALAEPRWDVA